MPTCSKCFHELKDYGGYKDKMNPAGISLTDVWKDIPPVRHKKFKRREEANELSIKLMDRIITMSSRPGDVVLDPFGGSGTTYAVAEILGRNWIGMELGPVDKIVERLTSSNLDVEGGFLTEHRKKMNVLFPNGVSNERIRRGYWVPGNIPKGKKRSGGKEKAQIEFSLNQKIKRFSLGKLTKKAR